MALHLSFLHQGLQEGEQHALHIARIMVLLMVLLVSIIGGRVIPFFSRRGAPNASVGNIPFIGRLLPVISLLGIISFACQPYITRPMYPQGLMIAAGVLHLIRLWQWDSKATQHIPLLWSLHIAYGFLGIGLITLGVSYFSSAITFSHALHLITLGTIGGMILAMMARVSLGHTGRTLTTSPLINTAFVLIFSAVLVRFFFIITGNVIETWNVSGILWIAAFTCFLVVYIPILCTRKKTY